MSYCKQLLKEIADRLKEELYFYEYQAGLIKQDKIDELNYLLWVASGTKKGKYNKEVEKKYQEQK
jgi:hypothetical protein